MNPFDHMYEPYHSERAAFGDHWVFGGKRYAHATEHMVAFFRKSGGDGQSAEVFCTAMPARFYRVAAMVSVDSVGEEKSAFSMSTGSGCARLAADVASAIADGMLSLDAVPT